MVDTISLSTALKIIEQKDAEGYPIPFDISFRTLNRNSKTGGRFVTYNGATILTSLPKQRMSNAAILMDLQSAPKSRKNPDHHKNRTRNLAKPNGEPAKVRIRLIKSINNKDVVY